MSDIIKLLPDSVANQIAAGEVIQRPASVVKELVENAVDAGATEIKLVIRDAGKTMIQVSDNGTGMSAMDARMAFERHATSKIRKAEDLFNLRSMGFRGEALPSICAISEVEVKTRTADNPLGTRLVIEGSRVQSQEPCACDAGTVMTVKKLFYNTPARRKFLKSDSVELSNIMREFERLALVNHKLRMSIDTEKRTIDLRPGTLRQRIEEIWKKTLNNEQLLPVEMDTPIVKIEGYISRPEFARRRNPLQYMIVNGRNMRHPYFHKAVMSCYETLIAAGTQPCYFLVFTVDPESIDVNIHPTKNEVKFENEQEIWPLLVSAIRTSLGKFSAVPSIDFNSDAMPFTPVVEGDNVPPPSMNFRSDYNPFERGASGSDRGGFSANAGGASGYNPAGHNPVGGNYRPTKVDRDWQSLYDGFKQERREEHESASERKSDAAMFSEQNSEAIAPMCLQFERKYIVTTSREGLIVIDQHRAHVKILYEEYLGRVARMEVVSQSMMFPEAVSLDASQQAALAEIEEDLRRMGFNLEYESDTDWRITSVPALLTPHDVKDTVLRILDSVTEDSANYGKDGRGSFSLQQNVALIMARSGAIRGGVRLSNAEMENLVGRLFSLPEPSLTPNGNPVFTVLTEQSLAKIFKS